METTTVAEWVQAKLDVSGDGEVSLEMVTSVSVWDDSVGLARCCMALLWFASSGLELPFQPKKLCPLLPTEKF